jgi:hypothetical protein
MVESGKYDELLEGSLSFSRLLENIHQQKPEQHETGNYADFQRSSGCLTISETDNEEFSSSSITFETKNEGAVKWSVYISYIQAGIGVILGTLLVVFIFGLLEATSVFYNWWLAEWSNDVTHRHQTSDNCTGATHHTINSIKSMTDTEWNTYQNHKFYIYAGSYSELPIQTFGHTPIVSLFRSWSRFAADHLVSCGLCQIYLSQRWSNITQQVRKLNFNRVYVLVFS